MRCQPPPSQLRFAAMGTTVVMAFVGDAPRGALGAVTGLFARWEATFSRFRPGSELSRINRAAGRPVPITPLMVGVLRSALAAARATDGLFDPALGRQMAAAGYPASSGRHLRAVRSTFAPAAPAGAWRAIRLDVERGVVTLPRGAALDLGGIAKGMAVDAATTVLATHGMNAALVSAGGDMRVAANGVAEWVIGFDDAPHHSVTLGSGAIATSTVLRRRWTRGGIEYHHLLEPSTGRPSCSGLRSVSVAAPTCAQAEVAAKATLLLGHERGRALLTRLGLAGMLTTSDGSVHHTPSWSAQVAA